MANSDRPTRASRHVDERGVDVREARPVRPDELRQVDLRRLPTIPVNRQTSTVASRMLRRGFCTSSDSVEIPSKPM